MIYFPDFREGGFLVAAFFYAPDVGAVRYLRRILRGV